LNFYFPLFILQPLNLSNLPEWIIELNVNAQKSKTLRRKIKEENPDNLEFREKVLKFTAAAIESKEKPKLPEQPETSKNQFVIKGKEVAFGAIDEKGDKKKAIFTEGSSQIDLVDDIDSYPRMSQEALKEKKDLGPIKKKELKLEKEKVAGPSSANTSSEKEENSRIKELETKRLRLEMQINRIHNKAAEEDNGEAAEALREEAEQLMEELNEITDQLEQAKIDAENAA
jgi:hypothetical protein